MQCGLFGKLPLKRDFVTIGVPRAFLGVWEGWLDAGLTDSRAALGEDWKPVFFEAPIWRFCLGRAICGATYLGAMMPSVDAVGRCFPLTLVAYAAKGETLDWGSHAADEAWFAGAEECLLGALDPEIPFDLTTDRLAHLAKAAPAPGTEGFLYRAALDRDAEQPLSVLFEAAGGQRDTTSFWWTHGGASVPPLAFSHVEMPAPDLFTSMLTGRFAAHASTS